MDVYALICTAALMRALKPNALETRHQMNAMDTYLLVSAAIAVSPNLRFGLTAKAHLSDFAAKTNSNF